MPTVNLDTASRLDIICRKGDTFDLTVDFGTALSDAYAGGDFKIQVRDTDTSTGDPLITAQGTPEFSVNSGELRLVLSSSLMDVDGGEYVYDLQSDSNGVVKTWLHGFFTVIEDITE